jgi:hypothetical protein
MRESVIVVLPHSASILRATTSVIRVSLSTAFQTTSDARNAEGPAHRGGYLLAQLDRVTAHLAGARARGRTARHRRDSQGRDGAART